MSNSSFSDQFYFKTYRFKTTPKKYTPMAAVPMTSEIPMASSLILPPKRIATPISIASPDRKKNPKAVLMAYSLKDENHPEIRHQRGRAPTQIATAVSLFHHPRGCSKYQPRAHITGASNSFIVIIILSLLVWGSFGSLQDL